MIKLLEKRGAKPLVCVFCFLIELEIISLFLFFFFQICDCDFAAQMAPMHVRHAREVPEYEIDPKEIDFTNSVEITKVLFFFFSLPSFVIENIQRIAIIFVVCFVS